MSASKTTAVCRNCESSDLLELGFIGVVAPFFLKRVLGVKLGQNISPSPFKRFLQSVAAHLRTVLDRISKPAVLVEMQMCRECTFIQSARPFHEQDINRLYLDYRSATYNAERTACEPSYGPIAAQVGQGDQELALRVTAATAFLSKHVASGPGFSILDYGGADGKFLPRIEGEKFVFEISNIEPIAGVTRVHTENEMGLYSLVQLTHVIEHVVEPLQLVRNVAGKVAPGGFLYLETPQELPDSVRAAFLAQPRTGDTSQQVHLHEHINSYSTLAVEKLIEAAGLSLVAIEAQPVDVGWGRSVHIRALGQKLEGA